MAILDRGRRSSLLLSKNLVDIYTNNAQAIIKNVYFSQFVNWTNGESRPTNGSLLKLITKDSVTTLVAAE